MKKHLILFIALSLIAALTNCDNRKTHKIIHVDLDEIYQENIEDSSLVTGWYYIVENEDGFKRQLDRTEEFYYINPKPILVKEHFEKLEIYETDFNEVFEHNVALSIQVNENYTHLWADATGNSLGNRLALIIEDELVCAPMVNARIEGGKSSLNRGVYSKNDLEKFKLLIEQ